MKAVVIGGGIAGLAAADELTRRGVEVDLLEKGPETGRETSSAAAGILAPQAEAEGPGPFLDLLLSAAQLIPEAVSRLESLSGIPLHHRVSGMLTLAFSDRDQADLDRALAWQRQAGLAVEPVRPEVIRRMEPAVDGPVRSGIYWPQTAQIDPRAFARAYEKVVRAQGGRIFARTTASRVRLRGRRVAGVESSAGFIETDWVVHCAGPWAGEELGLPFSIPSIPARGQMIQFETAAPLLRAVVKSPRAYLVQRSDRWLIAGTTLEYVGFENRTTEEGLRGIHRGIGEISSTAGFLKTDSSWAGLRPDTPDHLPILGPTPVEGLLLVTGLFRNGILLAPLAGRLIADRVLGVRSSLDLSPFGLSRFMAGNGRIV